MDHGHNYPEQIFFIVWIKYGTVKQQKHTFSSQK